MSETLFKKLGFYLGLSTLIVFVPLIISIIYNSELLIFPSTILFCITCVSEIIIVSNYHADKKRFREVIYLLIPIFVISAFISGFLTELIILPIILGGSSFILLCIALFIFNRKRTTLFLYIFMILIFLGILIKRFHLPGAGVVLSFGLMPFGIGMYIYGIMSLSLRKKNRYLSIIIPICSFILAVYGLGVLYKIQHWPGGGIMIQFSTISIILVTIIVLLTLPQSRFFNWSSDHKKLFFRNTMIPWLIAAFFIGYYFLMPPKVKETIFPPQERIHFNMYYYELNQADTEDSAEK